MASKDQLEGRNPVLECLMRDKRKVISIRFDRGAKPERRLQRIIQLAKRRNIPVEAVDRRLLDKLADGRVHNGVVATAEGLPNWTTKALIETLFERGQDPFLIVTDGLAYEHNLGAVLRSSLGFGANGLIIPTRRGASLSPVVQRVSMGAVEEVPIVSEGLFSALKTIKRAGIPIVGADMGGETLHNVDLTGPMALCMGAEGSGLSSKMAEKCDRIVRIPLSGKLESLNVSVAAAVIMYERARQLAVK